MNKVILEVEVEGQQQPVTVEHLGDRLDDVLKAVREKAGLGPDAHVFEKDKDDELASLAGRKAISLVVHRCKRIEVHVRFEHRTLTEKFPPSATIFRVLRWAVGKKGFNLDDTAQAKANLIIPGSDAPLPRETVIGKLTTGRDCSLTLELTLKDFTNG